jgi:hypothetical protein
MRVIYTSKGGDKTVGVRVFLLEHFLHSYSNPISNGKNFTWEPLTANSAELAYLHITNSTHLEMRSSLDIGHGDFWDSLPINEPQHNVNIPDAQQPKHHEL